VDEKRSGPPALPCLAALLTAVLFSGFHSSGRMFKYGIFLLRESLPSPGLLGHRRHSASRPSGCGPSPMPCCVITQNLLEFPRPLVTRALSTGTESDGPEDRQTHRRSSPACSFLGSRFTPGFGKGGTGRPGIGAMKGGARENPLREPFAILSLKYIKATLLRW